jgi:hypothetical protein
VRHVQPENIHAGIHQLADHLGGIRGRAKGGNDFCAAQSASLHGAIITTKGANKSNLMPPEGPVKTTRDRQKTNLVDKSDLPKLPLPDIFQRLFNK